MRIDNVPVEYGRGLEFGCVEKMGNISGVDRRWVKRVFNREIASKIDVFWNIGKMHKINILGSEM